MLGRENFEPASTLEMESVIPPIPGLRAHHMVLRNGVFDYATNARDVQKNLFSSAALAEAARQGKAKRAFGKGSLASKTYLEETKVVFRSDGDKVTVGGQEMTHVKNFLE